MMNKVKDVKSTSDWSFSDRNYSSEYPEFGKDLAKLWDILPRYKTESRTLDLRKKDA